MTEPSPEPVNAQPDGTSPPPPELKLPGWVGAAIGITLVVLGAMAVYTGFHSRSIRPAAKSESSEPSMLGTFSMPEDSGGAPGAPEAGASRIAPGSADNHVSAQAPRVPPAESISVRRAVVFSIEPSSALVFVNGAAIGPANQFSAPSEAYEFGEAGTFVVKFVADGYRDGEVVVVADNGAAEDVAVIGMKLERR